MKAYSLFLSVLVMVGFSACDTRIQNESKSVELYDYDVEEKIAGSGLELTVPADPVANYVHAVRSGNLVFLSGKGPRRPDNSFVTGKLGKDITVEEGYEAARLVGVEQLSALKAEIGDLNRVVRIVKVVGMVNSDPAFTGQSQVVNGYSDLMVEIFGERGKHARAAVGMSSLPLDFACEIEMIVEVMETPVQTPENR